MNAIRIRRCLKLVGILIGTFAVAQMVIADESERRGYWWYHDDPPPQSDDAKQEHPDLGPPPSEDALLKLHPKDVEKMLGEYLDYALWKMTPEHVEWYYRVQDFARRRSDAFVGVTQYVMLKSADLNMNAAYPQNNPGQDARRLQYDEDMKQVLDSYRTKAAVVLLSRRGCHYCDAQRNALKYFQQQRGWDVREVDIEDQPEMKVRFSVETTPTTVVIFRNTDQWMPVSVGVDSVPAIEQGVYRAVRLLQGQTTPETYMLRQTDSGGVLDPRGVRE
jgi:conjugal transfer pilus assembly protein TraF